MTQASATRSSEKCGGRPTPSLKSHSLPSCCCLVFAQHKPERGRQGITATSASYGTSGCLPIRQCGGRCFTWTYPAVYKERQTEVVKTARNLLAIYNRNV